MSINKITNFVQVEEALNYLGAHIMKHQQAVLVGGAALLEIGLKQATKDVDLLMTHQAFNDIQFDLRFWDVWSFGDREAEEIDLKKFPTAGMIGPWKLRRFLLQKDKQLSFSCTVDVLINDQLFEEYAKKALSATIHDRLNVARIPYAELKQIGLR